MQLFEILLLAMGVMLPFALNNLTLRANRNGVFAVIGGAFLLHLFVEGLRWQMIPIYLVLLILLFCVVKNYTFFKGGWLRKVFSGLGIAILLGLGGALATILPVFTLPTPTGQYAVGTQDLHLQTDAAEIITEATDDRRELMIKAWYPAEVNDEPLDSYLNAGDRTGFATKYGLPKSALNYLNKVETHTYQQPKVAAGEFPVLIFSHGYYSPASGYYALLEEIVSQGYIVLNVNHTYESVGSVFPDGSIKLYDSEFDRKNNNQEMAEMAWMAMQDYQKASTDEEKLAVAEPVLKNYIAAEVTRRWANDIKLVLNKLPIWATDTFLNGHINRNQVGVFGHSQGGAAAAEALLNHPEQLRAGMNIDGIHWGNMLDTMLTQPFLNLSSDWTAAQPDFNRFAYRNGSVSAFYDAKVLQAGHSSFMDIPYMIRLALLNEAGTIEPTLATEITAKVVTQFFDQYLKRENVEVSDLGSEYEKLEIKKR
ncbi:MAG: alpha/beta hydrolase family protein [Saprospiraceae bacterium]